MGYYVWIIYGMWAFAIVLMFLAARHFLRSVRHLDEAELNLKVRQLEGYLDELRKSLEQIITDKTEYIQLLLKADKRSEAEKQLVINEPKNPVVDSMSRTQDRIGKEIQRASAKLTELYAMGGSRRGATSEIHEVRATKKIAMAALFLAFASIIVGMISWLSTWILAG